MDHWRTCIEESGIPECSKETLKLLDSSALGYLGNGDRALLRDAVMFGCDTFLTMENKLHKNSNHLRQTIGIFVESPCGVWARIRPWAALYRKAWWLALRYSMRCSIKRRAAPLDLNVMRTGPTLRMPENK